MKELIQIQKELKSPKSKRNEYGGYNYRSAEDILNSLKPVLAKNNCYVVITDTVEAIEGWHYVKATATIYNEENNSISVTAYAREVENRKGMDPSQITGAASSYARKYALNGLFAIDDTKDADDMDNRDTAPTKKEFIQLWNKKGKPKTNFDKWENLTDKEKREQIKKLQEVS